MSSTKSNQISTFVYEPAVDAINAFGEIEVLRKSPLLIETRGQYGRMSLFDDSISRVDDRKYLAQFCYSVNLQYNSFSCAADSNIHTGVITDNYLYSSRKLNEADVTHNPKRQRKLRDTP